MMSWGLFKSKVIFLFLCSILFLSACGAGKESAAPTLLPPTATVTAVPTETPAPTNTPEPTPTPVPEYILLAEGTNPYDLKSFPEEIQQVLSNFEGNPAEVDELVDLVFNYYETFDTKYRSIIPLKSVYVPQSADE